MVRKPRHAVLAACLLVAGFGANLIVTPAMAASVDVTVHSADGRAAESAVVELIPDQDAKKSSALLPRDAEIDQHDLMFMPLVTIIPQGGRIVFANHDTTMHQVYSFSTIKRFEFEIAQGGHTEPVTFDKTGVASIGCNIHDHMAAFVYVAQSPFVAQTDKAGHAHIGAVPAGAYHVTIWHPLLPPGQTRPTSALNVTEGDNNFSPVIPILPGALPGKKPMHMQGY